jgi:hypothetical protein
MTTLEELAGKETAIGFNSFSDSGTENLYQDRY